MIERIDFDRHGLSLCSGNARPVPLAATALVCYNASRRQFNTNGSCDADSKDIRRNCMVSRRAAIALAGFGLSAMVWPKAVSALDYPTRPVRFIVGYPAGGATDILARLIGQRLSERLGQQFVVENKPGAGNNIGTETVINAEPDGYTVLLVNPANAINASLYAHLNFNFIRDIAPVAGFARVPNVMVVPPDFPAKTVADFIAYAKANPGKVNMASSGNGTSIHLSGELFKAMTGVDMLHVPYRGSAPAITDLLGGRVQVMFDNMPSCISHIKSGSLRALAVTTATRSPELPDVPSVGETVKGYEASAWFGMGAPKKTPTEIIASLNGEINAILDEAAMKARIAELGGIAMAGSPGDFAKVIAAETDKWAEVVKFAGAHVD
jgi:tripartite-type tricarboxylate transporter receptor subunit TctC